MSGIKAHTVQQVAFKYHGPDAIRAAVDLNDLIEPVAQALKDFSRGLGEAPIAFFAPAGRDGDVHVKSAWLPGRSIFTVKVASWFAARAVDGKSGGSGVIAAFDAKTGDIQALLQDDHYLSDMRTAAAGALATRHLARPDARIVGVLGTGVQAYLQVVAVIGERQIDKIMIWGRNDARVDQLAAKFKTRFPALMVVHAKSPEEICATADIIITTTASTSPLIEPQWLHAGQHITAMGADDPHKCEIAPACFQRIDRLIVDSRKLTLDHGDIHRAFTTGVLTEADIDGELGEVIDGRVPARQQAMQITLCKLIGLGVQDLAAVEVTLKRLA